MEKSYPQALDNSDRRVSGEGELLQFWLGLLKFSLEDPLQFLSGFTIYTVERQ